MAAVMAGVEVTVEVVGGVDCDEQWRLCFVWTDRGVVDVEIADYH